MQVNKELIEKVAATARIDLTEQEIGDLLPSFKEVLEMFAKLEEVDTKNSKPLFHPVAIAPKLREDVAQSPLGVELALKNAKQKKDHYILGPKAV